MTQSVTLVVEGLPFYAPAITYSFPTPSAPFYVTYNFPDVTITSLKASETVVYVFPRESSS